MGVSVGSKVTTGGMVGVAAGLVAGAVAALQARVTGRGHAVIVVAEGAGQEPRIRPQGNRTVLQERSTAAKLRRAHELPGIVGDLVAGEH